MCLPPVLHLFGTCETLLLQHQVTLVYVIYHDAHPISAFIFQSSSLSSSIYFHIALCKEQATVEQPRLSSAVRCVGIKGVYPYRSVHRGLLMHIELLCASKELFSFSPMAPVAGSHSSLCHQNTSRGGNNPNNLPTQTQRKGWEHSQ